MQHFYRLSDDYGRTFADASHLRSQLVMIHRLVSYRKEYNRYYSLKASLGDDLKEGLISKEEFDDFREKLRKKM